MNKKFIKYIFIGLSLILLIQSCKKDPYIWSMALSRGAYLQMLGSSEVIIRWRTSFKTESVVKYGSSPNQLTNTVSTNSPVTDHQVQLSGLQPSAKYYYSIGSSTETLQGDSNNYFVTAPAPGTISQTRIWVIGDAGTGMTEQDMVRDAYLDYTGTTNTDVWLWLGDNAYSSGKDDEFQKNVFNGHYENILKNTCAWPAIGNHDFGQKGYQSFFSRNFPFPYYDIFTLPANAELGGFPSGTEKYYSFNYSNIHFIALDSYASYNDRSSEMYNWLKKDLSSNTQKWTIVYFHHPPYTKGSHDSDTEEELIDMRENIVPLLEQYGVDLVLSGHSHTYERSFLMNGHYGNEFTLTGSMILNAGSGKVPSPYIKSGRDYKGTVYIVAGASGKAGGTSPGAPHDAMYYTSTSDCGSMVIDVNGDMLNAKYIDKNKNILDEFSIKKL